MKTVKEGYEFFRRVKSGETHFSYYFLDSVAMCLFEDYEVGGFGGFKERKKLDDLGLGVYEALNRIESFEDFEALIARLKLELSICE